MSVRNPTVRSSLWMLFGLGVLAGGCSSPRPEAQPATGPEQAVLSDATQAGFRQPASMAEPDDSEARVALGRMLFFDKRLSKNHDVACYSCHDLESYGVDGRPVSVGHRGLKGGRNAPTVFHAAGHVAQFWDGRAATLEAQAQGPLLNPLEMAMPDEARVVATLSSIPAYLALFREAFPGVAQPIELARVAEAIAAFERTLVTRARFDHFVEGDASALDAAEQRGFATFVSLGCANCHAGPALGGTSFQRLGAVQPFPRQGDPGRYTVTRAETDRMVFRVPTLRNIEKTGPYFHDGLVAELPEAVRLMGRHQLGRELHDAQVADLVAFLRSLTGALTGRQVEEPALPPSTSTTPRPDPS